MITGAFAAFLQNDSSASAIRSALANYNSVKSIHTDDLPGDAPYPAILVSIATASDWGTRGQKGGQFSVDIQVFAQKTTDRKAVWDLAEAVWFLLNRNSLGSYLSAEGWEMVALVADPPVDTQDGLGFPGYTIKARLTALRT